MNLFDNKSPIFNDVELDNMINNKAIDFDRIEKWSIDFQLAKVELDEYDEISDYCREGCCHQVLVYIVEVQSSQWSFILYLLDQHQIL